jgi:hypothetical protein
MSRAARRQDPDLKDALIRWDHVLSDAFVAWPQPVRIFLSSHTLTINPINMDTVCVIEKIVKFPIHNWNAAAIVEYRHVAVVCASDREGHLLVIWGWYARLSRCGEDVKPSIRILGHVANITL